VIGTPRPGVRLLTLAGLVALAAGAGAQQRPSQTDPRTGLIVGQVVDAATEKPIGGAIVAIGGSGGGRAANGQPAAPQPRILTRADGRFFFGGLPRGNFTIGASKAGYAGGAIGRRRPDGPSQTLALDIDERVGDVIIRMWKLGAIGGTVVDETGEQLVRVQLRAWRRTFVAGHARLAQAGTAFTDDRGRYRFGALMPGDYVIAVSTRHVVMPLSLLSTEPRPGVPVLQVGDFLYGLGTGVITPPPPGERFWMYPPSFHAGVSDAAQATVVTLRSGDERLGVDLQARPVPSVRVSGVLVAPGGATGRQVVRLVADGRGEVGMDQDAAATAADESGAFVFPAVPPGTYTLRSSSALRLGPGALSPHEMVWAAMPLQVGGTDIDGITVTLSPGLRISGYVEFDGSSPRPTAAQLQRIPLVIEAADADGEYGTVPRVLVDERGDFASPGLVGGSYVVRVTDSPPGWMFKSATLNGHDISSSPLDLGGFSASGVVITFTDRWSAVHGTVESASRSADGDALVTLFPTDSRLWTDYGSSPRRIRGVRTSRSGAYAFGSVAPGEYYIAAIPDEKAGDWQDPEFLQVLSRSATRISVADGEQRRQDLRTRVVR
jgi:hypothetical protein